MVVDSANTADIASAAAMPSERLSGFHARSRSARSPPLREFRNTPCMSAAPPLPEMKFPLSASRTMELWSATNAPSAVPSLIALWLNSSLSNKGHWCKAPHSVATPAQPRFVADKSRLRKRGKRQSCIFNASGSTPVHRPEPRLPMSLRETSKTSVCHGNCEVNAAKPRAVMRMSRRRHRTTSSAGSREASHKMASSCKSPTLNPAMSRPLPNKPSRTARRNFGKILRS
mmetsp:Transcript_121225/g.350084  ORF Transcript_121225/g.350084 Transcript_121225/m.350084 type:complete len:229 (+) Transcript_121225:612-1298(+)